MLTTKEIIAAACGKLISGKISTVFTEASTDSRSVKKDSLFIPLYGRNHDGHDFIEDAFKNGAGGVIYSKILNPNDLNPNKVYIKVKNSLRALADIAQFQRNKFKIPVVGVTGSSGKTTTKDMIASILSQEIKILKTEENYNTEIGLPITLFKLDKSHKAAVLEMAMQGLGEIEELARISKPNITVITNIGEAHLESLKSKKAIAAAKSEILKYLNKNDYAVLPADDSFFNFLKKSVKKGKIITFGKKDKLPLTLPIPGQHNINNALAAIAVAKILGIKDKSIIKGLANFKPSSKRMDIFVKDGIRIINDTYNANPSSMKAALMVLREQGPVTGTIPPRRIAVLGDMMELGRSSQKFHSQIGKLAAEYKINRVIAVGKHSKYIATSAESNGLKKSKVFHFKTKDKAIEKLKKIIRPNDVILVKGSRGMKMEEIVEAI